MAQQHLQPPFAVAMLTYFSYFLLFMMGHFRDWLDYLIGRRRQSAREGYAPLRQNFEDFYTRRLYLRIADVFNRPICSAPDAYIDIIDRKRASQSKPFVLTDTSRHVLNLASYNYLGFAASDAYCTPRVLKSLRQYGWSSCSPRAEAGMWGPPHKKPHLVEQRTKPGTTPIHLELEDMVAKFLCKEACLTYGMGFATNSATIPAMLDKGCLVLSDALNHASIVAGVRNSGARVKVFEHNNANHLEALLRASIAEGQPRTHRPWKKILIIIEGIYSMEGEVAALKDIVRVKKKYKAYLYLDEAHSIGALGKGGRGLCEHAGVDFADVDVLMGTFTKSFGSCGGYIAGNKEFIDYLRHASPGHLYATSMSVPAVEQVISALKLIQGHDGTGRGPRKMQQLRDNSNYFRRKLKEINMMPIMLFNPGKIPSFSRLALDRGIAITVVGFPATPLMSTRARICISAAHTREDLDWALKELKEVGQMCQLDYVPQEERNHAKELVM